MTQSTHYNLNLVEGTDLVNPLVQDVPNYEAIDLAMYDNKVASIGKATELVTGTVHALTREDSDTPVFRFTATSNFVTGETFVVDGVQVTALTPSGETLSSGSYIIGSEVLVALRDTLLTVYVSGTQVADNALALEGHPASYFGTAEDTATAQSTATASGVLAQSCQTQITELNENLATLNTDVDITSLITKDSDVSSIDDFYAVVRNGVLYINGVVRANTNTGGGVAKTIMTLPSGYRPLHTIYATGNVNGKLSMLVQYNTDGKVTVTCDGTQKLFYINNAFRIDI